MLHFIRDLRRSITVSQEMTRAVRAFRQGNLPVSRSALDTVLAATDPAHFPALKAHRATVRLLAVTLRAEVTAKLGDEAATRTSIEEGLAMWKAVNASPRPPGKKSAESFQTWEAWARGWLQAHP